MMSWIGRGFGLLKLGWGMFAPYRLWAGLAAAGVVLTTILVFYGSCKACKAEQPLLEQSIAQCEVDISALRVELGKRNERIATMNARLREQILESEMKLNAALAAAEALRADRDSIQEDLEVTRFELLEAIRDDEEVADWVDGVVPVGSWRLLQQAAEGE